MRAPLTILLLGALSAVGPVGSVAAQPAEIVVREREAPARERADELIDRLEARTGEGFERYQTKRFIVVSDAPAGWVRERSSVLERSWHRFYRFARRGGIPVVEPSEPLVAVVFGDFAQYESWAREVDGVSAPWVGGYYTTRGNKIVLFDDRTSPAYLRAREQLEGAREQLRDTEQRAAEARREGNEWTAEALERAAGDYAAQLRAGDERLEAQVGGAGVSRTVHEAVHQLSFNSGLQRADRVWPFWFSEGLATAFETEDSGRPFGPAEGSAPRDAELKRRVAEGDLLDWGAIVAMPVAPPDADTAAAAYTQAYGLFRYLARHERDGLVEFVRRVNDEGPDGRAFKGVFEEVFGDSEQVGRSVERWAERQPQQ